MIIYIGEYIEFIDTFINEVSSFTTILQTWLAPNYITCALKISYYT